MTPRERDWGIPFVTGSEGHVKRELYPMATFKTEKEVLEYPWPDFMPSYRHEHLEKEVRKLHDRGYAVIGRLTEISGGFIIAPTHFVPAQVPWENVQALFDAVEEFGQY